MSKLIQGDPSAGEPDFNLGCSKAGGLPKQAGGTPQIKVQPNPGSPADGSLCKFLSPNGNTRPDGPPCINVPGNVAKFLTDTHRNFIVRVGEVPARHMQVQRKHLGSCRLLHDDSDGLREGLRCRTHLLERRRRQLSQ